MLATYPMHGQYKLCKEGYRTRDGHLIEWFSKLLPPDELPVHVYSRPEPSILRFFRGYDHNRAVAGTEPQDVWIPSLPTPWNPKKWWVTTADKYPVAELSRCVVWNPLIGLHAQDILRNYDVVSFDLLDDWTRHFAFSDISNELTTAYGRLFDRAEIVTANSEGTLALARRFGREDAQLVLNGCDPERFTLRHIRGNSPTVGYIGKIGHRLDVPAIEKTARSLPAVKFVFGGPVIDKSVGRRLRRLRNVTLIGDVHYDDLPAFLERIDIGWVPHGLGKSEVGGDVIKTYEYRAAGLPVLTTPVIGAGDRGLSNVFVLNGSDHGEWIEQFLARNPDCNRVAEQIPPQHTWKYKAQLLINEISSVGESRR